MHPFVHSTSLGHRQGAGFSLLELMIVVMLVGLLAVLAIPTMSLAQFDRHTYQDAASIGELFRTARTRAIGRGAAQAIQMTAAPGADRGTFRLYEAQSSAPSPPALLPPGTPMNTCTPPTQWPGMVGPATNLFIDGVNLNGNIEGQGNIFATITDYTLANVTNGWACFTPLGRVYYTNGPTPAFTAGITMNGLLQITVLRQDAAANTLGITRTVLIPPSGSTRILSK